MSFMELNEKSRRVGWKVKNSVQKDEDSMENIDEFFNDTETSIISKRAKESSIFPRNALAELPSSEINSKKRSIALKPSKFKQSSYDMSFQHQDIPLFDYEQSNYKDRKLSSIREDIYETNYDLESEYNTSVKDEDILQEQPSLPDLEPQNESEATRDDSTLNTSENALLEHEIRSRNLESAIDQQEVEAEINSICFTDDSFDVDYMPNISEDTEYIPNNSKVRKTIRKSNRIKIPVLDYWRNERVVYKRKNLRPILDIEKIITFDTENQKSSNRNKQSKLKSTKSFTKNEHINSTSKTAVKTIEGSEEAQWLKNGMLTLNVPINENRTEKKTLTVAVAPHLQKSSKITKNRNENFILDTLFDEHKEKFASGILKLPAKAKKSTDNSGNCFMTFHVTHGTVMVCLEKSSFVCTKNSSFQIPAFNSYKLHNVGDVEVTLFFVQVVMKDD